MQCAEKIPDEFAALIQKDLSEYVTPHSRAMHVLTC